MNEKKFEESMQKFYDRDRRKDRIIIFQSVVILVLFVVGIMFVTYQARVLKDIQVASAGRTVVQQELSDEQMNRIIASIKVKDGRDGANGLNGVNGSNGRNGSNGLNGLAGANITADQIATAVAEWMRLNPIQALIGPQGAMGEQQLLRVDPDSCELMTKYLSDDSWSVVAILPKPCSS